MSLNFTMIRRYAIDILIVYNQGYLTLSRERIIKREWIILKGIIVL